MEDAEQKHQRARRLAVLALVALVVGCLPVFGTRFLNDMEFYALVADKLLAGGVLYRDALDTKPPLVFVHYGLVFKLFGLNNATAVKVVTVVWLGLSARAMVAVRRALSPSAALPGLAAPVFVLASLSGWGEEFLSSNTEVLANLFIVGGVWLLVSADFAFRPLRLIGGGVFVGIACLYRYQSGAALLAYLTVMLWCPRQVDRGLIRLLLVGGGLALPGLVLVASYAQLGALADLRLMLALQAHYACDADPFEWPTFLGRLVLALAGLWPVLLLAAGQAVTILRKRAAAPPAEVFQLMFAVWSVATFFVGGRFFPHYGVQAIPALTLLAVERLGDRQATGAARQGWFVTHALAIMITVAAVFTAINGVYYWTRDHEPRNRAMVTFIETHSRPGDEVLLWAWRPRLLLETGRVFATRLLVNGPLIGQLEPDRGTGRPRARRSGLAGLWSIFLRDLAVARPRLIIDDVPGRSAWSLDRYPQVAPLLASYHACQVVDELCVYVRKD